jgi:hypothetical protein
LLFFVICYLLFVICHCAAEEASEVGSVSSSEVKEENKHKKQNIEPSSQNDGEISICRLMFSYSHVLTCFSFTAERKASSQEVSIEEDNESISSATGEIVVSISP